jgi:hypothetical protein
MQRPIPRPGPHSTAMCSNAFVMAKLGQHFADSDPNLALNAST